MSDMGWSSYIAGIEDANELEIVIKAAKYE
jgi:hypothetical protein